MKYVARTLRCSYGVVGLNGWQYLMSDTLPGEVRLFDSPELAEEFLSSHGLDIDESDIEIVECPDGEVEQ